MSSPSSGVPANQRPPLGEPARRLRIAMILPSMSVAGMEVMVLGLTAELRRRGHDATIVCTEAIGALEPEVRRAGIPVQLVPAPGLSTIVSPKALAAHLRTGRFDVAHSHNGVNAKAARAARLGGVPAIVHTMHGFPTPFGAVEIAFELLGALQTHIRIGVSDNTVAFYRRWFGQSTPRVDGVSNGIDVAKFCAPTGAVPLRESLGLPPGTKIIGNVARLDPVKNQQFLIRALHLLPRDWHLALVGDGVDRAMLEALTETEHLRDRVHFLGVQTVSADLYQQFDVFALSSLTEGMPMTILEAFCARVPVVGASVGGIPNLLAHGARGAVYDAGDPGAFVDAIIATQFDRDTTSQRIAAAYQKLEADHTLTHMASAYEQIYARAMRLNSRSVR
jgi:glycosyltransferase involved in cell wall biosynthesis